MTVPLSCPPPATADSASVPRKRRRRAPATGASDDCFACSKRNTKCDRRRPYCSQCLEVGNECSGYKTQLTWGVGVASRGKLRGLSLPIAKSAPAQQSSPRPTLGRSRTSSTVPRQTLPKVSKLLKDEDDNTSVKIEGQHSLIGNSYTTYDFVNMVPTSPSASMQIPSMGSDWTSMSQEYLDPRSNNEQSHQQLIRQSLQRLSTPTPRRQDLHIPHMRTYSENEFGSQLDHTFHLDDSSYLRSPQPLYTYSSTSSPVDQSFGVMPKGGPTSCPNDQFYAQSDLSSSLSSHQQTIFETEEPRPIVGSHEDTYSASEVFYDDTASGMFTDYVLTRLNV